MIKPVLQRSREEDEQWCAGFWDEVYGRVSLYDTLMAAGHPHAAYYLDGWNSSDEITAAAIQSFGDDSSA